MMSPHQLQQTLFNFPFLDPLSENEITQQIIIPTLQKVSMRNGYRFRGLHFTGGRDEQGTDIEYYEMIGPDSFRHYTGIQVKKMNISVSAARELINQGNRAFEKEILGPDDGRSCRIHRWIVATTGTISPTPRGRYKQSLPLWQTDSFLGRRQALGEYILEAYHSEFVDILNVPPTIAGQTASMTNLWDADDPPVLADHFDATDRSSVEISPGAPPGLRVHCKTPVSGCYASGHGKRIGIGRAAGDRRTAATARTAQTQGRQTSRGRPVGLGRHRPRPQDGHTLGDAPQGDGLRVRFDVLAEAARLTGGGRVAKAAPGLAGQAGRGRPHRLV